MSKWISERTQNHLPNRSFLLGMSSLVAAPAFAHHGWRFTPNGEFELRGIVRELAETDQGFELTVDVDGESWLVELGSMQRKENEIGVSHPCQCGDDIRALGQRAVSASANSMVATQLQVGKKKYGFKLIGE